MKRCLPIFLLFCFFISNAQLPSGSIAPDFTATDINGDEWDLYEILADGKFVVLEMGATWSDLGWDYHQSYALENFYQNYGAGGTDEAIVFFVETDDGTTLEDLFGTGDDTHGDWTDSISYPIIDDAGFIADLYESYTYPDIILICPNRVLRHVGRLSSFSLYQLGQGCLMPFGSNNAGILSYNSFSGHFCGETVFAPAITFQNLGTGPLTEAVFELFLNGILTESKPWSGNLQQYGLADLEFETIALTDATSISVQATNINNTDDDAPTDNTINASADLAPTTNQNFLYVEIQTDDYPQESYWEIVADDGSVLYAGGNGGIFDGEEWDGTYTQPNETYTHEIPLPANGCYEMVMYDGFGDGICCDYGLGSFRIRNPNNSLVLQGGLFGLEDRQPFKLEGAETFTDNGSIIAYEGEQGEFCGELNLSPTLVFQNHGSNEITAAEFAISDGTNQLETFAWDGSLLPGKTAEIDLPDITIQASINLFFSILNINNADDDYTLNNEIEVPFFRRPTNSNDLSLEIKTDNWGYEIYWQMTSLDGDVIASGGNQTVGPDGGGLREAEEGQPGAYDNNASITETITLPAGVDDCYEFLIVDDWGDGLGGIGSFHLEDVAGNLLFISFPTGVYESYLVDAQLATDIFEEVEILDGFSIFPNPANEAINVHLAFSRNTFANMEVINALGEIIIQKTQPLSAGNHQFSINVKDLAPGVYFSKMTFGKEVRSGKFLIQR